MSIYKAIDHAVSEVESEINDYTVGFVSQHYALNYEGDEYYQQVIHATAASLDKLLQFRAYLKGYADSPVDEGLRFESVMKYNAMEYLKGWKNYRDVMNMLRDEEFRSNPAEQMARIGSVANIKDAAAYWAIHLILEKIKRRPSAKLSNLIALISEPVDDFDLPLVETQYLGK